MRRFYLVSRNADVWEVRIGADGSVRVFGTLEAARRFAVDAARLAWVDEGNPTGVKELLLGGTWEVGEQFGLDA